MKKSVLDPKADEVLSVMVTFLDVDQDIFYLLLEQVCHLVAFSACMPLEMSGITKTLEAIWKYRCHVLWEA